MIWTGQPRLDPHRRETHDVEYMPILQNEEPEISSRFRFAVIIVTVLLATLLTLLTVFVLFVMAWGLVAPVLKIVEAIS